MKGEVSPWFARAYACCSPPSLAGAQSPHPQRPACPAHPPQKSKRPQLIAVFIVIKAGKNIYLLRKFYKIIRRNSLYLALLKIFDVACNYVICTYFSCAFVLQTIFEIMEVFS